MDVYRPTGRPFSRPFLMPRILRLSQMILNIFAVIMIGVVLIMIGTACPDEKWSKNMQLGRFNPAFLILNWTQIAWFVLMCLQLTLSVTGIIFFFLRKMCKTEDSWKVASAICNIFNSHSILFSYLLGSQIIFSHSKLLKEKELTDCQKNEKNVANIAIAAVVICQLDSILHFVSAFYPFPYYFVKMDTEKLGYDSSSSEEVTEIQNTSEEIVVDPAQPQESELEQEPKKEEES